MWTIHKFIVLDCANFEYIGITEDEATDKSSTEQESICLRFVDESYNEPRVREEIVGLVKADSMKTEVSDIVCSRFAVFPKASSSKMFSFRQITNNKISHEVSDNCFRVHCFATDVSRICRQPMKD